MMFMPTTTQPKSTIRTKSAAPSSLGQAGQPRITTMAVGEEGGMPGGQYPPASAPGFMGAPGAPAQGQQPPTTTTLAMGEEGGMSNPGQAPAIQVPPLISTPPDQQPSGPVLEAPENRLPQNPFYPGPGGGQPAEGESANPFGMFLPGGTQRPSRLAPRGQLEGGHQPSMSGGYEPQISAASAGAQQPVTNLSWRLPGQKPFSQAPTRPSQAKEPVPFNGVPTITNQAKPPSTPATERFPRIAPNNNIPPEQRPVAAPQQRPQRTLSDADARRAGVSAYTPITKLVGGGYTQQGEAVRTFYGSPVEASPAPAQLGAPSQQAGGTPIYRPNPWDSRSQRLVGYAGGAGPQASTVQNPRVGQVAGGPVPVAQGPQPPYPQKPTIPQQQGVPTAATAGAQEPAIQAASYGGPNRFVGAEPGRVQWAPGRGHNPGGTDAIALAEYLTQMRLNPQTPSQNLSGLPAAISGAFDQLRQYREGMGGLVDRLAENAQQQMNAYNQSTAQRDDLIRRLYGQRQENTLGWQGESGANLSNEYMQRQRNAMDIANNMGASMLQNVQDKFAQERARVPQSLINRGLYNTTIQDSLLRGVTRGESKALNDALDRIAQMRLQTYLGTSGDRLGADERLHGERVNLLRTMPKDLIDYLERIDPVAPDMRGMMNLALTAGQAGGLGSLLGAMPMWTNGYQMPQWPQMPTTAPWMEQGGRPPQQQTPYQITGGPATGPITVEGPTVGGSTTTTETGGGAGGTPGSSPTPIVSPSETNGTLIINVPLPSGGSIPVPIPYNAPSPDERTTRPGSAEASVSPGNTNVNVSGGSATSQPSESKPWAGMWQPIRVPYLGSDGQRRYRIVEPGTDEYGQYLTGPDKLRYNRERFNKNIEQRKKNKRIDNQLRPQPQQGNGGFILGMPGQGVGGSMLVPESSSQVNPLAAALGAVNPFGGLMAQMALNGFQSQMPNLSGTGTLPGAIVMGALPGLETINGQPYNPNDFPL